MISSSEGACPGEVSFEGVCHGKGVHTLKNKKPVGRLILLYDTPSAELAAFAKGLSSLLAEECSLVGLAGGDRDLPGISVPDESDAQRIRTQVPESASLPIVMAETQEPGDLVELLDADVIDRVGVAEGDLKGRLSYYASLHDLEIPYQKLEPEPAPRRRRRGGVVHWVR